MGEGSENVKKKNTENGLRNNKFAIAKAYGQTTIYVK